MPPSFVDIGMCKLGLFTIIYSKYLPFTYLNATPEFIHAYLIKAVFSEMLSQDMSSSLLLSTFIPRLSTLVHTVFASVWSQLSIICIQLYIVIIYLLHKQEFPFMVFCFYESMAISNIAICDVRHSSPMYTVLLKWEKIVQYHMRRSHHYWYWPYIYVLLENIITNNSRRPFKLS